MIPRTSRIAGMVALATTAATLGLTGIAGAKAGDKTYQQTYPLASKLCATVAAGKEGKHLKKFATQVTNDCTTLQATFTGTQASVLAVRTALTPQLLADKAAFALSCPLPNDQKPGCKSVRKSDENAIESLNQQLRTAARHYWKAVEAARDHFWKAIRALPDEKTVHEDGTIHVENA